MKDGNYLKANNARSMWHPMTAPADSLKNPPAIITGGQGVRITDIDGHEVVDGVGGLWNVNLGYSCQPVKDAITLQMERLPYYSTFRGTSNDCVIELAEELRTFFEPDGLVRAFFTSGGSDSVETALRLSRQYHKIRGDQGRVKFLSLKKGYHGTHMGGASVNGNANFRTMYEPLLPGCHHIPAPYTYRNPFNETDPAKLAQLCLAALEDEIAFQGAATIAAFIMEPILGAGGVILPHESFMPGVEAICRKNGILLIADEVITAFGRTGAWTGSRLWGVKPDFACTAKAITNGYFPFGATMISERVAEVFETDESGKAAIGHGYTYSGHPVGAAAALACLAETQKLNLKDNAAARGAELHQGLLDLQAKHELIGDVRGGHGLMCAIELVADRTTKKPADKAIPGKVQQIAYQSGAMVRVSGNNIIMSPPLVLTSADVQVILSSLDAGFTAL
ncbi:aminotransferase class III-fold pyridoxal phosphate-dependent enzyme [Cypionkella sp.]|uniref:aminotransferase class III-fold pyridoxal phosphate-dependent enzyme n=1 Tax=Cypionkella sp. TaxID=2811411 RepID=UPI002ABA660E|nr:aminotransferase class III-fold pyridoxal phosphate-dependent enzyme [Cypionkella sp.]MDZ4276645.1 aminotransferase class III-fold pyridoxal phosphate-dependent enzyme [Erythrobacter sp.]MDZ4392198.1 aminotransferase class III-fold pyridoxal phosphate-dependent enzyme [Cypionkella sp.]